MCRKVSPILRTPSYRHCPRVERVPRRGCLLHGQGGSDTLSARFYAEENRLWCGSSAMLCGRAGGRGSVAAMASLPHASLGPLSRFRQTATAGGGWGANGRSISFRTFRAWTTIWYPRPSLSPKPPRIKPPATTGLCPRRDPTGRVGGVGQPACEGRVSAGEGRRHPTWGFAIRTCSDLGEGLSEMQNKEGHKRCIGNVALGEMYVSENYNNTTDLSMVPFLGYGTGRNSVYVYVGSSSTICSTSVGVDLA